MVTDNKKVNAYLPPKIEAKLIEFCREKGLTRKYHGQEEKPQLGTAIVEILEDYFGLSESNVLSNVPSNDISQMIDERLAMALTPVWDELLRLHEDASPNISKETSENKSEEGLSLNAMGYEYKGTISRNTIEAVVKGGGNPKSKEIYRKKIEPYYYWDAERGRFYPKTPTEDRDRG